jgi:hypothetical protein
MAGLFEGDHVGAPQNGRLAEVGEHDLGVHRRDGRRSVRDALAQLCATGQRDGPAKHDQAGVDDGAQCGHPDGQAVGHVVEQRLVP